MVFSWHNLYKFVSVSLFIMANSNNKINMPSSGAGLTQFYADSESKVHISPKTVIAVIVLIAILIVVLQNSL
jgi:preprotein translocase subunit Sec61beta